MKIIITGANGMLGSSLCQLYHNEHKVHALHRDKECFTTCSVDYSLDLTDTSKVADVINQINPDLVIHCASMTSLERCEQNPNSAISANVLVTENVVKSCSAETKLVYISTDQVYGKVANNFEANEVLKPVNQYGQTKLLGEQKVQDICSDHLIVRTNIFGWNVKPDRVSSAEWIYNSLRNGQGINLFNDYTFSPISTKYLGKITMQLVDMDFTGVINVGSPSTCSKYEFGLQLAEDFGFDESFITKGSIKEHQFSAERSAKLDLNCNLLAGMEIKIPDWRQSLKLFAKESKRRKIRHYHNNGKRII
jgi:dTDP-4-dehydrorhamnose reductase